MKMATRINQAALAEKVSAQSGVRLSDTTAVLRALFEVISREVVGGARISVTNFGTWFSRLSPAVQRRNPQNGEPVDVPAHYVPAFAWAPLVRAAVRAGAVPENGFRKRGNR